MLSLRPAKLDDAAAWARIVAACSPYLVQDAASQAHEMRTEPSDAHRLVAVDGDEVVGVSRLRAHEGEEHVSLLVMVAPRHRRCGIGGRLMERQLEQARTTGRPHLHAIVEDDEPSRAAAARWGFELTRTFRMAMVDPREVPDPGPPPSGITVLPLSALGPRVVWKAHSAVVRDDPSGLSLPLSYEEFLAEWSDPRMRPALGRAVLLEGELASFTMMGAAADRAWSDMTGTMAAHRGRGLAFLAKHHALRAAAAAGITRALTGNDAANAPMVSVNDRLGYRRFASPALASRGL